MQSDLLNQLNSEQLAAVTWPPASALVLAGAGSGKTRVLTTRIAWLIQTGQTTVHNIMAVTFTNKAAKEMHSRLSTMLPISTRAMWIGTFHGLCHRLLRLHHRDAELPSSFQILDHSDQLSVIKRTIKSLNISEEYISPKNLQNFINAKKEAGLRATHLSSTNILEKELIACYQAYDTLCQEEGLVDFNELLLRSYELLQHHPAIRTHYQNRFNHILIDEFQDTNELQYAWIKLLAGSQSAIFAVGDDDQSIYRFRGAQVGNMRKLLEEFHIEYPIKLEQNYRSVGHILTAANAVISHNQDRLGKILRTSAANGEKIRLYCAPSDIEEAYWIIQEIQMLEAANAHLDEIAILYRNNAQSRVIEHSLFKAGIPYKIYGGLRFYERQEIKHALAYLRLTIQPNDNQALLRVINFPPRGIGSKTIEQIQSLATAHNISLWESVCQLQSKHSKLQNFVQIINKLSSQANQKRLQEIVHEVIHESGLLAYYQLHQQKNHERIDNLEELISAAWGFNPDYDSYDSPEDMGIQNDTNEFYILAFLNNAALESGERQAKTDQAAVQLMTIHAAKGLEFDNVFLSGMEEGIFPSDYSLMEKGGLEEERRLMYVAITRARKRLSISMARNRFLQGRVSFGVLSRFVDEIPEDVIHHLSEYNAIPKQQQEAVSNQNEKSQIDYDGFMIGQNVRHNKFGLGVIIHATNKGEHARLTINFGTQGIKELDTAFAQLTPVD